MQLCIALDMSDDSQLFNLLQSLHTTKPIWLKVGLKAFIRGGKDFLQTIKSINNDFNIFLDLKLYDIPNTMADAVEEICKLPVDMFTVHLSAGKKALEMVKERLCQQDHQPMILGVSALTSFDEKGFQEVYGQSITTTVVNLAQIGHQAGLDGVVCSVYESRFIKQNTHAQFITLTPAIRLNNSVLANDQKRVATIQYAKQEQVDFVVIGRAIYQASHPKQALKDALEQIDMITQ